MTRPWCGSPILSDAPRTLRSPCCNNAGMSDKPLVILAEPITAEAQQWLESRVELVTCTPGTDEFNRLLPTAAGLIVRTSTRVDESMLRCATDLRVVARAGVGLDNIDQEACRDRNIEVLSTPDANTQAVVEYVIAIVTNELRPRTPIHEAVDADGWADLRSSRHAAIQMDTLRLGILGLGRIGRGVGRVAGAIGFETIYTDLLDIPEGERQGARPVALEELLSTSDVLSIHVDGRDANRDLLGVAELAIMKENVLLVNTSRGFVIDATALSERLQACPDMHAVLDVHAEEPIPGTCPLLGLPNVTLLPHAGARTGKALADMSSVVRDLAGRLGID